MAKTAKARVPTHAKPVLAPEPLEIFLLRGRLSRGGRSLNRSGEEPAAKISEFVGILLSISTSLVSEVTETSSQSLTNKKKEWVSAAERPREGRGCGRGDTG